MLNVIKWQRFLGWKTTIVNESHLFIINDAFTTIFQIHSGFCDV